MTFNESPDSSISDLSTNERITARLSISPKMRAYAILIVLSVIWGLAFVAIKAVEPLLSPVNLTVLRWFLASAGLLALAPFIGRTKTPFDRRDVPRFLLVAFANVVAYHLTLNFSEKTISAGLAVLLVAIGPVFILLLSRMFLKERAGRRLFYAVLLAFTGAVVLSYGSGLSSGESTLPGILEALGTALSYATFAVFSKPLVQKYGSRPVAIWTGLTGTVMLLPLLSGSFFVQIESLTPFGWAAMLYLSVLSTVVGYMLFYTLIGKSTATRVSIQLYLIPLVGVLGGALLLGESITTFTIIGGGAMLLAVAIATRAKN